jgi:hypothetical protein
MAKFKYKDLRMQERSLRVVERANQFIDAYLAMGLRLTLRQLYYRFVAVNFFKNCLQSYKRLGHTISEARLAGLVDWDAIIDRGRGARQLPDFKGPADAVDWMLEQYRLERWADQPCYVELWCEKDAILGAVEHIAQKYHVPLASNRGYSSQTAMRDAANRFIRETYDFDAGRLKRRGIIFYIGDHDPSGEDMTRDILERFQMFGAGHVEFVKLTLTKAQVREFKLPPNPAKQSDSRFKAYRAEHGTSCWETDALEPDYLANTVESAIKSVLNTKKMAAMLRKEKRDVRKLKKVNGRILKGLKRERGEA